MADQTTDRRLDNWLFRARFFKKRSDAARIIEKGKVRVTRDSTTKRVTKCGYRLLIGDQVTFMRGTTLFQVEIMGFPYRRGPASEARENYRIVETQICDTDDG